MPSWLFRRDPCKAWGCLRVLAVVIIVTVAHDVSKVYMDARFGADVTILQSLVYRPGSDGTYAQNYQDQWVVELARLNNWTHEGFFLDVGAYDGIWCSNTYLLERQLGWRGVCVEPFPRNFAQRRCELVRRAISDRDGHSVTFYGEDQKRTMNPRGQAQNLLSTVVAGDATTVSFATLLRQTRAPRFINFVNIDVEGNELTAIEAFPFDNYTVGAWIIERPSSVLRKLLQSKGYSPVNVRNAGQDTYFVQPQYWSPKLARKPWRIHPTGSWGC